MDIELRYDSKVSYAGVNMARQELLLHADKTIALALQSINILFTFGT